MSPENTNFLNENRFHYDILVRAGYVKQIDYGVRERLLKIIQQEFDPGYMANLWCGDCVMSMIKFCYEQYDKRAAVNQ